MINRALELQVAIDKLRSDKKRIKCKIFRRYLMTSDDWQILRVVSEWLKVIGFYLFVIKWN